MTPAVHLRRLGIQSLSGSLNPLSFTPCKLQIQGEAAEPENDSQSNQHLKLFLGIRSLGRTKSSLKNYPDPIFCSDILVWESLDSANSFVVVLQLLLD